MFDMSVIRTKLQLGGYKKIGSGKDRNTYALDENTVIKKQRRKGEAINLEEYEFFKEYKDKYPLAEVLSYEPVSRLLIVERVLPLNKWLEENCFQQYRDCFGVNEPDIETLLKNERIKELLPDLEKNYLFSQAQFLLCPYELEASFNWGVRKDGTTVIIDYADVEE